MIKSEFDSMFFSNYFKMFWEKNKWEIRLQREKRKHPVQMADTFDR